jgi:hypothetical protein
LIRGRVIVSVVHRMRKSRGVLPLRQVTYQYLSSS